MKRYIKYLVGNGLLVAGLLLWSAVGDAVMVLPLNLEQMDRYADRVFLGTVQKIEDTRDDAGRWCQMITFDVQEVLKGDLGATLTIKQVNPNPVTLPDGTQMRSTIFAGVPQYQEGEDVLVFLGPNSTIGFTTSVGLEQGTFRVAKDAAGEILLKNGVQNKDLFKRMQNRPDYQAHGLGRDVFQALQKGDTDLTLKELRAIMKGLRTAEAAAHYAQ